MESYAEALVMTARGQVGNIVQQSIGEKEEIDITARQLTTKVLKQSVTEEGIDITARWLSDQALDQPAREELEIDITEKRLSAESVQEETRATNSSVLDQIKQQERKYDEELLNLTVKSIVDKVLKEVAEEEIMDSIYKIEKAELDVVEEKESVVTNQNNERKANKSQRTGDDEVLVNTEPEYVVYDILKEVDQNKEIYCQDSTKPMSLLERRQRYAERRRKRVEREAQESGKSLARNHFEFHTARQQDSLVIRAVREAEEFQRRAEHLRNINLENHPELYSHDATVQRECYDYLRSTEETEDVEESESSDDKHLNPLYTHPAYRSITVESRPLPTTRINPYGALPRGIASLSKWHVSAKIVINSYWLKRQKYRKLFSRKRESYIKNTGWDRKYRKRKLREEQKESEPLCPSTEENTLKNQHDMFENRPAMTENVESDMKSRGASTKFTKWQKIKRSITLCFRRKISVENSAEA